MPKTIGTVISSFDGPSTYQFNFVIKDSGKITVRKGQFIQLKTEEGIAIGRVNEVLKTNRYFMQAESVREYEKSGKPLPDMFPVDRWEYLVAKVTPLGVYNEGTIRRVTYPPSPGTAVEEADEKMLSDFLGFDIQKGLNIGKLAFHDLNASLNLTKIFQKHCSILAQTGAGKSYLISILLEEILDRPKNLGKPAVIIVDPHGEYSSLKNDENYKKRTRVFNKNSMSINFSYLSAYQISEFLPNMSPVQRRELIKVMNKMKKNYRFKDLIEEIENSSMKTATKETLTSWLLNLELTGLFSYRDRPMIKELAKPGQLSILDISDFIRLKEKQIIVAHFVRKLFNARRKNKVPPFILIIEEAHQFCPEGIRREGAISKGIIEMIAREGRKFNASLVLVSQRPIRLSTTALSQCNSSILLKIANPYDIKHVTESCEGITSDIMKMLPGLKVGEAIITGNAVNYPLLVHIRQRKSKESDSLGMGLEEAISSYAKDLIDEKDLETFM